MYVALRQNHRHVNGIKTPCSKPYHSQTDTFADQQQTRLSGSATSRWHKPWVYSLKTPLSSSSLLPLLLIFYLTLCTLISLPFKPYSPTNTGALPEPCLSPADSATTSTPTNRPRTDLLFSLSPTLQLHLSCYFLPFPLPIFFFFTPKFILFFILVSISCNFLPFIVFLLPFLLLSTPPLHISYRLTRSKPPNVCWLSYH